MSSNGPHEGDAHPHIPYRRGDSGENVVVRIEAPRMGGLNDNLHRVTESTRARSRPANTQRAYDGKRIELVQYLDHAWEHDPYRRILSEYKVYRFIFYQCAREKRLSRGGQRDGQGHQFDKSDYDQIIHTYDQHDIHNHDIPFIQPQNGLKFQALQQYKAVIKEYVQHQLQHHTKGWEFIWTPRCDTLLNIVRSRGPEQRLKNLDEKVTHVTEVVRRKPVEIHFEVDNN